MSITIYIWLGGMEVRHVRHVVEEYVRFYNDHRPHQGLGNRTITQGAIESPENSLAALTHEAGRVRCRRFLGGLLRHYYRAVA